MSAAGKRNPIRWLRRRLGLWPTGPFNAMSDADLGACVRRVFEVLEDSKESASGIKRLAASSAGLFLIHAAASQKAGRLELTFDDVTLGASAVGSWRVLVHEAGEPECTDDELGPVTLRGWLKPGSANQVIDAFDRLTVCTVSLGDARC